MPKFRKKTSNMRYFLFAGDDYDPGGGADDLVGRFNTIEEAKLFLQENARRSTDWAHVYDLEENKQIKILLCDCGRPGIAGAICPYSEERGEIRECECCEKCRQNCAMDT